MSFSVAAMTLLLFAVSWCCWNYVRIAHARRCERRAATSIRNVSETSDWSDAAVLAIFVFHELSLDAFFSPTITIKSCPDKIVAHYDVGRLFVSAFLHGSDLHLYHNMYVFFGVVLFVCNVGISRRST